MTIASGSYGINGTEFPIQPTIGHWLPREVLGHDGDGHPVYPGVREFEMRWEIISLNGFSQLQDFYDDIAAAGTKVVHIPWYRNVNYVFQYYTGCTLTEPQVNGGYFTTEGYVTDVTMVIKRIRV